MTDETAVNEAEPVEGAAAFAAKAVEVVRAASIDLRLFSECLDARLWGGADFADTLRTFLLGNERANLKVLVNQPPEALRNAPRMIELCRRLTSKVEIRQPPEERRQNYRGDLLLADRSQFLERREAGVLTSKFWRKAPAAAYERISAFDELWNQSEPSDDMRTLGM